MVGVAAIAAAFIPSLASAAVLTRQLELGMSGSDVSTLQSFLAQDPTIYPQGLVTGYFGSLTKSAVSNFQVRNDIPSVGRVGPVTLGVINAQMNGGIVSGADVYAPTIANVITNTSTNGATISWITNEPARSVVYYSSSPLVTYEFPHSVSISGASITSDTNLHTSDSVVIPNLTANTTYYFMVYETDAAGNVSVTWPSTFKTAN